MKLEKKIVYIFFKKYIFFKDLPLSFQSPGGSFQQQHHQALSPARNVINSHITVQSPTTYLPPQRISGQNFALHQQISQPLRINEGLPFSPSRNQSLTNINQTLLEASKSETRTIHQQVLPEIPLNTQTLYAAPTSLVRNDILPSSVDLIGRNEYINRPEFHASSEVTPVQSKNANNSFYLKF